MTTQPRYSARQISQSLGLHAPTPQQQSVIEAPLEPSLIIAGAGSGKTETMSARVVWLIANELVRPDEILGLTFTRKAAGELDLRVRHRLRSLVAANVSNLSMADIDLYRPRVATYNSYAADLVREHGLRIAAEPDATLLTDAGSWQLAAQVVDEWQGVLDTDRAVSTVIDSVRRLSAALADNLLSVDDAQQRLERLRGQFEALPHGRSGLRREFREAAAALRTQQQLFELVREFRAHKRSRDLIEFSDQVQLAARLARELPDVAAMERGRYRVVLLDEYQDTSFAQVEMLAGLFGSGHPVTAVGDPNQAIYGWRGASPSSMTGFPDRFSTSDGEPATVHSLNVSWRNRENILAAANFTASPLRQHSTVDVAELVAPETLDGGKVTAGYYLTIEDEAAAIADRIAVLRHDNPQVEAAVLCRNRKQFPVIAAALHERGLPVDIVGLGGLLDDPAVSDILALLTVAHDLSRGDALMRLLTGPRWALGTTDIAALHDVARRIAHRGAPQQDETDAVEVAPELIDEDCLAEAVDELTIKAYEPERWPRPLSDEGLARIKELGRILDRIRRSMGLSLPDLIVLAERSLGLDIEAAVSTDSVHSGMRARLDAFYRVTVNFNPLDTQVDLGTFLNWVDVSREREGGLDQPMGELDKSMIQLITIHGAKGLEWDFVAVAGLVDGDFPKPAWKDGDVQDKAWLEKMNVLPWPLRGDYHDLPSLELLGHNTDKDANAARMDFLRRSGEHAVREERRLAYVAITRARDEVHLSTRRWATGVRPGEPSVFITELVEARLAELVTQPLSDLDEGDNPRLAEPEKTVWPTEVRVVEPITVAIAHAVQERMEQMRSDLAKVEVNGAGTGIGELLPGSATAQLADLLLSEARAQGQPRESIAAPQHLSPSAMVALAKDRDAFVAQWRRPIPLPPSSAARRGTAFHAWVEQHFHGRSLALFDLDVFEADPADDHSTDIASLQQAFLESQWAAKTPVAVEHALEITLAGTPIRMKIDAVFADDGGRYTVVDWKSGRAPRDEASLHAAKVQLAIYRFAWADYQGIDAGLVSGHLMYLGDGREISADDAWTRDNLEDLIRAAATHGGQSQD